MDKVTCIVDDPRDFWTPRGTPRAFLDPSQDPPGVCMCWGDDFRLKDLFYHQYCLPLNWHCESEKGLLDGRRGLHSPLDGRGDLLDGRGDLLEDRSIVN